MKQLIAEVLWHLPESLWFRLPMRVMRWSNERHYSRG
jgi:hypothetical protein